MKLAIFSSLVFSYVLAKQSEMVEMYEQAVVAANDGFVDADGGQRNQSRSIVVESPDGTTLSKIWNYGCWCYFQNNHGRGRGTPQNEVDGHCRTLHHGYTCILMDAADENDICDPFTVDYNTVAIFGNTAQALEMECVVKNPNDNCKQRSCSVEARFILMIIQEFFGQTAFDPDLKHALGLFNPDIECPNGPGSSSDWECCGHYPVRYPYKTFSGDRGCCGKKTFDTITKKCCTGDIIDFSC